MNMCSSCNPVFPSVLWHYRHQKRAEIKKKASVCHLKTTFSNIVIILLVFLIVQHFNVYKHSEKYDVKQNQKDQVIMSCPFELERFHFPQWDQSGTNMGQNATQQGRRCFKSNLKIRIKVCKYSKDKLLHTKNIWPESYSLWGQNLGTCMLI